MYKKRTYSRVCKPKVTVLPAPVYITQPNADDSQMKEVNFGRRSYYVAIAGLVITSILTLTAIFLAYKANTLSNHSIAQSAQIAANDHNIDTLHRVVAALQRNDSLLSRLLDSTIEQNKLLSLGVQQGKVQIESLGEMAALSVQSFNYLERGERLKWEAQIIEVQHSFAFLVTYYYDAIGDTSFWKPRDKLIFFVTIDSVLKSQLNNIILLDPSVFLKWQNAYAGFDGFIGKLKWIDLKETKGQISPLVAIEERNGQVNLAFQELFQRFKRIIDENGDNFKINRRFIDTINKVLSKRFGLIGTP